MYQLMTPGPVPVAENVRMARSLPCSNPDLDLDFYEYYKETCELISSLLYTNNTTLILNGEGILGLEAACASLTEPRDRVLIIDNGIYGKGFADFVSLYDGEPVLYTKSYTEEINVEDLRSYLESDHNFKYATVVHCDTPSGMLNDISRICPLLKEFGILTVVDSVSAMFGEEVRVDDYQIDLLCGGSQKVVSAPPGLTFVTISDDAYFEMRNRKTKIHSFYANLTIFDQWYEKKWFPYTMPISDIYGLRTAFENIQKDVDIIKRHREIATYVRQTLCDAGIELYQTSGFSNTVTVFKVPNHISSEEILSRLKTEYHIMIAGSFGCFAGQVLRIGHMGENARIDFVQTTITALIDIITSS